MVMCAYEIQAGTKTVGDFVLINAMMIQLYQPLNFMGMVYREIKQAVIDIEIMFSILSARAGNQGRDRRAAAEGDERHHPLRECRFFLRAGAPHPQRHQLRGAGRQDGGGGRPVRRRQVDDLAAAVPLLRSRRRPHPDRRPGHRQGDAEIAAPGDRHGAAGHRAVQRHHPLQHPLRPLGSERRRGRGGGRARADRRFHPDGAQGLRDRSRRARPETIRRREAARRHRAHDPEGAADPGARRGDLGARQPHRKGNPGRARARVEGPHHAGDRAPALDHRRRRRDHRARPGRDRRARHHTALLAKNGLYASMWNRQREAEEAREKLARAGEDEGAPNRNPPPVEDAIAEAAASRSDGSAADAAE